MERGDASFSSKWGMSMNAPDSGLSRSDIISTAFFDGSGLCQFNTRRASADDARLIKNVSDSPAARGPAPRSQPPEIALRNIVLSSVTIWADTSMSFG